MLFAMIGLLLTVIPLWVLMGRAGYHPAWSLVSVTGIGLLVLLWLLAFGARGKGAA